MRGLLLIGLTLFSSSLLAERTRPAIDAICEQLLKEQSSEMTISPVQVAENQHAYLKHFGLDQSQRRGDGLLNWLGVHPEKSPQIVLVSLNNFFGDSMIFHFPIIDYFRKNYPQIPLTVISPNANVLSRPDQQDFKWEVFSVRFPMFRKREDRVEQILLMRQRLPGFLKAHIQPGAFVLYDLTTCDKADQELKRGKPEEKLVSSEMHRVFREIGATAVGISNLNKERIFNGVTGVEVMLPKEQIPDDPLLAPFRAKPSEWSGGEGFNFRSPISFDAKTIYESWLQNFSLLFGSKAYLRWDHHYFTNSVEDAAVINAFLEENGMDRSKEHVLINLNTFGGDKVRDLIPHYAETLKRIIQHVHDTRPELNILVTFPETQFGPEIQGDILDYAASLKPRVALIPSSYREIMPAFVATSQWLISYDSGLVHLASFLPANRVLSLDLGSGGAEIWRRPEQGYVKVPPGGSPTQLADSAIEWIDSIYTGKSPR